MHVLNYWSSFMPVEHYWHLISLIVQILILVISLMANLAVLNYLIRKESKKPVTYFLINLCISDLHKVIINMPMSITSSIYEKWPFGQIVCNIYGFTCGMFGFVSITTIAIMTIERYLVIRNSLNSLKISSNLIKILIVLIWLYSACWMIPELFSSNGFVLEGFLTHCSFDYISRDLYTRYYMIVMFMGGFFVPLTLILILNFLIWKTLKSKNKRFQIYKLNVSSNINSNISNIKNNQNELIKKKRILKLDSFTAANLTIEKWNDFKLIKTILLMIILFCVSWGPYAVITLLAQFGSNIFNYVTPLTTSLPALFAKTSTFMNPIIYSLRDKHCRIYIKKNLFCINKSNRPRYSLDQGRNEILL